MNYQQFRELLKAKDIDPRSGMLLIEWTIGGRRGGDCWGNDYGSFDPEPEPEFHELDIALETICPQLTYLQAKAIDRELVKHGNRTRDDYYGCHEEKEYREISLIELHAWLSEKGLLPEPSP